MPVTCFLIFRLVLLLLFLACMHLLTPVFPLRLDPTANCLGETPIRLFCPTSTPFPAVSTPTFPANPRIWSHSLTGWGHLGNTVMKPSSEQ